MSNLGTFDTFTTAQLGIYAAQHGLRVTGNNISNISTTGYTRQRIDQVSFKTGGADMYRSQIDNHVGSGALVTGISQIRDPYLDIRFRNTNSTVGYTDTWLDGLKSIASILDEVGKGFSEDDDDGLLYAQLQDLAKSLRRLSDNPCSDNDTLVRTSAETLCTLFNTYAGKLQTLKENTEDAFKKDLDNVNTILTNIRNLNEEIRNSEIHGDNALEMRDERNRQIDALSEYIHVNVVYSMEDIGAGQQVEKLTITLANDNPDGSVTTDSSMLIDGIFGAQLSTLRPMANKNLPPDYDPSTDIDDDIPSTWPYWNEEKDAPVRNAAQATLEESPNYDITISKLYDGKGRLWTNPVTTWPWPKVPSEEVPETAEFRYEIKGGVTKWSAGDPTATPPKEADKFDVAGTTCTVGDTTNVANNTISADDANTPEKLAEFIAAKLSAAAAADPASKNANYNITAENGFIVFTAKTPGKVADADRPSLTVTNGGNKLPSPTRITVNPGYSTKPKDIDNLTPDPVYTYDPVTGAKVSKTEVTYTKVKGEWYMVETVTEYSREVALDDNDLYGSLQATRELLTEAGEFATKDTVGNIDENALIKRGIPYYQLSLDLLARQVATQYNSLNHGYMINQDGNYIDKDGKEIHLPGIADPISKTEGLTPDQETYLINNGYVLKDRYGNDVKDDKGNPIPDILAALDDENLNLGAMPAESMGNLFSIRNDKDVDSETTIDPNTGEPITEGITASNITVSRGWSSGDTKVVTTYVQLFGEDGNPLPNTTQNENVNHMITMIEEPLVYDPKMMVETAAGNKLFTGGFNNMFSNIMSVEGKDQRIMNTRLTTSYGSLVELDSSRDGVSGVDLNDEAMNMMQYQKAYSAACRLMTVIDEALDRLINNTGIAGR